MAWRYRDPMLGKYVRYIDAKEVVGGCEEWQVV
jgi:hypothetical protein